MRVIHGKIVFEKGFSDKKPKEAYLKACEWLARNIYSKPTISESVTVKISKIKQNAGQSTTFLIFVYVVEDEEEIADNFCNRCKVLHNTFYNNASPNCAECKMSAMMKELNKQLHGKNEYIKDLLEAKE